MLLQVSTSTALRDPRERLDQRLSSDAESYSLFQELAHLGPLVLPALQLEAKVPRPETWFVGVNAYVGDGFRVGGTEAPRC
jgi:hypothetical protein